ncbi:MAG: hypothetical protein IPP19_01650 [Verrucomicrobia bacterium]|nr:hypothetical protein [Verrucomicrobiota bacterium]
MKSLLRKIILAVALCAVAGLGLADDKTKLLLDEVTRRVKQADAIEIDDLSQEVTVESGVLRTV